MANFWVTQDNDAEGWTVCREGSSHTLSKHRTHSEAVGFARTHALQTGGGEIVIRDRNGTVRQREHARDGTPPSAG